jgi:hypothetical protein
MTRKRRILILGTEGITGESDKFTVESVPWQDFARVRNVADYDVLMIDVTSLASNNEVNWSHYFSKINFSTISDILKHEGSIMVFGDPRLEVGPPNEPRKFLSWTGLDFNWDSRPGKSIYFNENEWPLFKGLIKHFHDFKYSLRSAAIAEPTEWDFRPCSDGKPAVRMDKVCSNRYQAALIAVVGVEMQLNKAVDGQKSFPLRNPVLLIPEIGLPIDETILLVLRDFYDVSLRVPEPKWLMGIEAPGQLEIDSDIDKVKDVIKQARNTFDSLNADRAKARNCLKLLYARGQEFEETVRQVLRAFQPCKVEDPQELGYEDGWITVQRDGKESLYGVLEAKSTSGAHFSHEGLRQLNDWQQRGRELRERQHKPIFVGLASNTLPSDQRPSPFADNFIRLAENQGAAAIRAEDLFAAYVALREGRVTSSQFWDQLFQTNGVFEVPKTQGLS